MLDPSDRHIWQRYIVHILDNVNRVFPYVHMHHLTVRIDMLRVKNLRMRVSYQESQNVQSLKLLSQDLSVSYSLN